jgi:hypothetical protein
MSITPEPGPPVSPRSPRVRLVQGQEVSLGCGTLVLIALIVMFCGGFATQDVRHELSGLRNSVNDLKKQVDDQTREIRELRTSIENLRRAGPADAKEK